MSHFSKIEVKDSAGKYMNLGKEVETLKNGGVNTEAVELIVDGKMEPLVNPVSSSLTITSSSVVEVGSAISSVAFSYAIGNPTSAKSAKIIDVSNSNATVEDIIPQSSGTHTETVSITKTSPGIQSYRLDVTDKLDRVVSSTTRSINWYLAVYYGSSSSETLDEAGIKALTKSLQSSMSGTYAFTGGATNYKYIIIPASFTTLNMFNASTGFAFPLTQVATVNVTNNGVTTSCKVLRTENQIGDVTARN
jgi:membrane-associated protease RseP (regulator of RpoE activity)